MQPKKTIKTVGHSLATETGVTVRRFPPAAAPGSRDAPEKGALSLVNRATRTTNGKGGQNGGAECSAECCGWEDWESHRETNCLSFLSSGKKETGERNVDGIANKRQIAFTNFTMKHPFLLGTAIELSLNDYYVLNRLALKNYWITYAENRYM